MRNILSRVPRGQAEMVAAFIRTNFAQPNADAARRQHREVATRLERSLPKAAAVLADAEDDVTAYAAPPPASLAQDVVNEPAGTGHQGDCTAHRRRPRDPQRRRGAATARCDTRQAARRVADIKPPSPHHEQRRHSRPRAGNHAQIQSCLRERPSSSASPKHIT